MRMRAHSTKILVPPDGSLLRKRVILGGSVAGSILTGFKKTMKVTRSKTTGTRLKHMIFRKACAIQLEAGYFRIFNKYFPESLDS